MVKHGAALIAGALVLIGAACGSGSSSSSTSTGQSSPSGRQTSTPSGVIQPGAKYHPAIDPANFRAVVDNPWFSSELTEARRRPRGRRSDARSCSRRALEQKRP